MSITKSFILTFILIIVLFFTNLCNLSDSIFYNLQLDYIYYIKSLVIIITYIVLILLSDKFSFSKSNFTFIYNNFELIKLIKIFLLFLCLSIFLYSLNLFLSFFLNFITLDLDMKKYQMIIPGDFFLDFFLFPFIAEFFFRKNILRKLHENYSSNKSIIISSLLFSISHVFSDISLLDAFIYGIILGNIFIKFGFLFSFISHIIVNLYAAFLLPDFNTFLLKHFEVNILFSSILLLMGFISLWLSWSFVITKSKIQS